MWQNYQSSVGEIIKASTPAQRILWNSIFWKFGENISVKQLHYCGLTLGSEFSIAVTNRFFFAYQLNYSFSTGAAQITAANVSCPQPGGGTWNIHQSVPVWQATAAAVNYVHQTFVIENFLFNILTNTQYNQINFIGFRINY